MKNLMILLLCGMLLTGCESTGVSQAEYDASLKENERLSAENEELKGDNQKLSNSLEQLSAEKEQLQQEYNDYKEVMKEYEGLSVAEAEARAIEAERIVAEQKAEQERIDAEEKARKEAEEKTGYETGITYDQLARTPDDYKSKKIKFSGKVVQVIEGSYSIQIRFAVNSNYDKILLGEYSKNIVSSRVLEDDIVTIYGTSAGLITYQSTMGGNITIPSVSIDKIDQ